MSKPELFSKVLGMPKLKTLLEDIEDLLVSINSGKFVDTKKFRKKCDSILDYLNSDPDLSWNITSPSIHILLHHSPDIIGKKHALKKYEPFL